MRHLEDDVVVDEVECVVERADGELGRPVELHVAGRHGPGARHGAPRRPVILMADDGRDDAVLVHHADVGTVGEEGLAVGRHRHPCKGPALESFSHLAQHNLYICQPTFCGLVLGLHFIRGYIREKSLGYIYCALLTFWIGESGICRLAAVAASVGVPGQAAGARPDEGVPVRVQFGARNLGGWVAGTQGEVGQLLEANDLNGKVELPTYHGM